MIDLHSHFLPAIDDGADSVKTSLAMLRESGRQGVSLIFATPHFYADEDDPAAFLARRDGAYARLREAMQAERGVFPDILLGAEVLYFPGMSVAEELAALRMGSTPLLLVEPPMIPWRDAMLDEIEAFGESFGLLPVIAHVDRYMRILRDNTLFRRLEGRRLLKQVNAGFFLFERTRPLALDALRRGMIDFIGSDCHNMAERAPNMGPAETVIRANGCGHFFDLIQERLYSLLDEN